MGKKGRIESSMVVDYIRVTPIRESGGHGKNSTKGVSQELVRSERGISLALIEECRGAYRVTS